MLPVVAFMKLYVPLWVCVVVTMQLTKTHYEWVNPNQNVVQTIFYQGMLSSQVQAARYVSPAGFIATTGELVQCEYGLDIINNVYIGTEIDEVVPWRAPQYKKSFWKSTKARFHRLISRAANNRDGIHVTESKEGPSLQAHLVRFKKVNIAQQNDLENHRAKYELCINDYPNDYIIQFGVSRGAATTFAALASNNYDLSKIKLVILEGCFDTIDHLIKLRVPLLGSYAPTRIILNKLLYSVFRDYQYDGINPLSVVDQFPHSIPVLFITSQYDKNVPIESTVNLAGQLAKMGHPNVYLLVLKSSGHNGYYKDNLDDRYAYRCVVHALYKKLTLPYIPFYAEQGEQLLNSCKLGV